MSKREKVNIDDIRRAFELEGYQLLSTEYLNASQKLDFICPQGHTHSITWTNWKRKRRCGVCAGKLKKDINEIRQSFEAEGYQLLTSEYKNQKQRLDFICPKGHKHFMTWTDWKDSDNRCGLCAKNKKKTIDEVRHSFEFEGYKLITSEYINEHAQLEYICPNGHQSNISWNSWQSGRRCKICAGNVVLSIDDIRNAFEAEGYQLLTEKYENNKQPLDFICPNGHKYYITWHMWKSKNQRCGKCSDLYNIDITVVKKFFEVEGYNLLTLDYKNNSQKLEFICPENHNSFITWGHWKDGRRCPICSHIVSDAEKEIVKFLKPYFPNIVENDRNIIAPYELDIVIPSKKIAVEYCGLYWHSELAGKERNYHLKKLKMCKEVGYRLITIFEDEWINRRFTVEAFLKTILHINESEKIHARKCTIKEIDHRNAKEFLEEYHLLGSGALYISLGAYYNDQLVAVSTFSKPSLGRGSYKKKEAQIEWNRFCLHSDYRVPGIASKFLKHFERNYTEFEKIFTFADRRWSEGNLYEQLGFELVSETLHNYWYFKRHDERTHRFSLRKKSDEPKDQTEWEIRQAEGWNRIWDCGLLKFEKNIRKMLRDK